MCFSVAAMTSIQGVILTLLCVSTCRVTTKRSLPTKRISQALSLNCAEVPLTLELHTHTHSRTRASASPRILQESPQKPLTNNTERRDTISLFNVGAGDISLHHKPPSLNAIEHSLAVQQVSSTTQTFQMRFISLNGIFFKT